MVGEDRNCTCNAIQRRILRPSLLANLFRDSINRSGSLLLGYSPIWCRGTDLNCRRLALRANALPTELPRHIWWAEVDSHYRCFFCGGFTVPCPRYQAYRPILFYKIQKTNTSYLWRLSWELNPCNNCCAYLYGTVGGT